MKAHSNFPNRQKPNNGSKRYEIANREFSICDFLFREKSWYSQERAQPISKCTQESKLCIILKGEPVIAYVKNSQRGECNVEISRNRKFAAHQKRTQHQ